MDFSNEKAFFSTSVQMTEFEIKIAQITLGLNQLEFKKWTLTKSLYFKKLCFSVCLFVDHLFTKNKEVKLILFTLSKINNKEYLKSLKHAENFYLKLAKIYYFTSN